MLITAAAFSTGCSKSDPAQQQLAPEPYQVYKVKRQDMTFEVNFSASLKGINDVDIYPQVTGTIKEIRMKEGQNVRTNEVLFVIDKTPYEAAYERARASVASAEATVATAALTKSNMDKLYSGQKAVSYFDMQKSHHTYDAALASLAEAEANVKKAKQDLDNTEVKSPVDGVCGMTTVRLGTLVNPNLPAPMVVVSDNHKIEAYFSVSENLLLYMNKAANEGQIGDPNNIVNGIKLKLADGSIYGERGQLTAVSGVVDKTTGAITCRATFPNDNGMLKAGGSGSVVLSVVAKNGLVIPQTATYELQNKTFVYKVVDGKAKATAVRLMVVDDGHHYVVQEGLNEGDEIVASGVGLLREGTPIEAKPYTGDSAEAQQASPGEAKPDETNPDKTGNHFEKAINQNQQTDSAANSK
ncbi:MAG: efflux RND transporter periplasmic adaptor subunit [Succinivibrio sp.]|nr:efflux RND transporter periplasmic adaptor subunit [Succinivibrio sp.]